MSNTFLQNVKMVGVETLGNVQGINAGKDDDGTPIYYEIETQELEFGNRAHLKQVSDQLTVVVQDGMDSQIQAKENDGDYKNIPMSFNQHANIGKDINLEGSYFTFRWFGESDSSSPILEEIYIENIEDKGITKS